MTTEDTQPRLLAEWLAAPAGTPAPEGLDPEVAAAVYALRPDRAPAARFAMDDILGTVTAGPFARAEGAGTKPGVGARRTAGVAEREPRKRASRWWMTPAVGLSLAAAAALLLVIPMSERYVSPTAGKLAGEGVRAEQAASPPAAAAPAAAAPAAAAPAAAAPAAAAPGGQAEGWIPEVAGGSGGEATAPMDDLGDRSDGKGRSGGSDLAPLGYAERRKEEEQDASSTSVARAADLEAPEPSARIALAESPAAVLNDESDENVVQSATKAKAAKIPSKPSSSRPYAAPAPTAGVSKRSANMDKDTTTEARNGAIPDDYSAAWYAGLGEIAPAYTEAAVAGTTDEMIAAWTALIAHPDPRVGQDAAFRAASLLRGNPARALALVARGLNRSAANTPFRSNLLALKGDLLLAQNKEQAAESAWAEARSLNAER